MGKTDKKDAVKKPSKFYKHFKASGDKVERALVSCPKCGPGVFMARHHNRKTCGKCQYTEFTKEEKA
ncbi:MAG: 30S ribosomal protein S27ae [Nanoarchaeota archaeon]